MNKEVFNAANLFRYRDDHPLLKIYVDSGFWFSNLKEFHCLIYCESYLQSYVRSKIKKKLICNFSLFYCLGLAKNPHFVKFLESGFLRYINSNFLLCFHNNFFLSRVTISKICIEAFVADYYKEHLRNKLEKDFLICILKSVNNPVSCSFNVEEATNGYKKLNLKNKDIQVIFESVEYAVLFNTFEEEKRSIGPHNTLSTLFKFL